MSIKVGFANDNYLYDNLRQDNVLILNAFTNSNIININHHANTTDDMLINYKNKLVTGMIGTSYVIDDILNNSRLLQLNNSDINLNRNVLVNAELGVNNTLIVNSKSVSISSNVIINLDRPFGSLTISSNSYDIIKFNHNGNTRFASDDFMITNYDKSRIIMQADNTNTNFYNDVYIRDKILYVDSIRPLQGSDRVNIFGATYTLGIIDNFKIEKNLSIFQRTQNERDTMPLEICKRYGNANIVNIYSCNFENTRPIGFKSNFIINKDGLIGIGNPLPDATVSIKTVSPNIIFYTGNNSGDVFNMTQRADIGIGTAIPRAQIDVRRNDDLTNENIRRTPMINLDMQYNANLNYSNVYTNYSTFLSFAEPSTNPDNDMKLYFNSEENISGTILTVRNTFYLVNKEIIDKIVNISNLILYNVGTENLSDPPEITTGNPQITKINILNNLIYPSNNLMYVKETNFTQIPTNPNTRIYDFNIRQMTSNTYYKLQQYNNDTFLPSDGTFRNINTFTKSYANMQVTYRFNFMFEKNYDNTYVYYQQIPYTILSRVLVPAPNFMNLTYNNNFISSLSPEGILSLGAPVPDTLKDNCLLYTNKTIYTHTLNTQCIDTSLANCNISLTNKNLVDINKITSTSADINRFYSSNLSFNSATGNNIYVHNGTYDNLLVSNLVYHTLENNYLSFTNSNSHFKNRVSVGQSDASKELQNISAVKITIDNKLNLYASSNNIITHRNGILVTNDATSGNPSITVQTINNNTIPYLHIGNTESSYYFSLRKVEYISTSSSVTNNMQLINNNIDINRGSFFNTNNETPHILQHIQEYNLLTFGEENTICIDTLNTQGTSSTFNNKTPKISIGIPYNSLGRNVKDYPSYFIDTIKREDNPYMLNIFGNMCIKNINNHPIFAVQSTTVNGNHNVFTSINGEPDTNYQLRIFGNMATSNLEIFDDITIKINGVQRNLKRVLEKMDAWIRTQNPIYDA
jgi:hypothetical protein